MSRFIARKLCLTIPVALLVLCASSSLAQFQASISQLSPITPFLYGAPPRVIGDTQLPWYDRRGNMVARLSQVFRLTGTIDFNLDRVTVRINGKLCEIRQLNPIGDPTLGQWEYLNGSDPISVGSGPGEFEFVAQYYYDCSPIPEGDRGGVARRLVYVCKVERVGGLGADNLVNASDHCWYDQISIPGVGTVDRIAGSDNAHNTREIHERFRVTAPGPTNGDLSGITVGIIQTLNESSQLGSTAYHRVTNYPTPTPPYNATLPRVLTDPNKPFPWWDGDPGSQPWYGVTNGSSYKTWSTGQSVQQGGNWVWENGQNDLLVLIDRPDQRFFDQVYNSYLYQWGIYQYPYSRARGGTPRQDLYEDMLAATSWGCPGVYVPISPFESWEVFFDGGLDIAFPIWAGGYSRSGVPMNNKPETSWGPVNDMTQTGPLQFP
jgi:hypothetical protein